MLFFNCRSERRERRPCTPRFFHSSLSPCFCRVLSSLSISPLPLALLSSPPLHSLSFPFFLLLSSAGDALHLRPSLCAALQHCSPYSSATVPSLQPAAPFPLRRRPTLGGRCLSRGTLPRASSVLRPVGGSSAPAPAPPTPQPRRPSPSRRCSSPGGRCPTLGGQCLSRDALARTAPSPWQCPFPSRQRPLLSDGTLLAAHGGDPAKPPRPWGSVALDLR